MNNKFFVTRQNRALRVTLLANKSIEFEIIKYSSKLSPLGTPEIEERIKTVESEKTKIGDIIDGLLQPDVLHPIYKDIIITPFGEEGQNWIQIRWEGWNAEEIQQRSLLPPEKNPEVVELMTILETMEKRIKTLKTKGENLIRSKNVSEDQIVVFYRQTAYLLVDLYGELFPVNPWFMRGFLPLPFRRLALGRFQDHKSISIRLSPLETRRLSRFLRGML